MSRAMANHILALSAVAALLIVLNYTFFISPPANPVAAVPEIIGKTALLCPGIAVLVGVIAEALVLLGGRGRRVE